MPITKIQIKITNLIYYKSKMKLTKKASIVFSSLMFWMVFIIAVGFTTIAIVAIGNYFTNNIVEIPEGIEQRTIIPSLYNRCFAYEDDTGKMQSRSIDLRKFTQENFDKCILEGSPYSFSLSLEAKDLTMKTNTIAAKNWQSTFVTTEITENVFIWKENKRYDGKLKIRIKNE